MSISEIASPQAAATGGVSATGDQSIDGLLSGVTWSGTNITYSFPDGALDYDTDGYTPGVQYGVADEANTDFRALTAEQQEAARAVFSMIEAVCGLTFTEVTGANDRNATIRLAESGSPSTAWAYLPHSSAEGGDVWFASDKTWYDKPAVGTYGFHTFMHEIGHAVGLKHGHETGGFGALPTAEDSMEYSVMTYRSYVGASLNGYTNESGGYAQTLMINDIAALQQMYGANYSFNAGDTTYTWDPATGECSIDGAGQGAPYANRVFMAIWDGGGDDTYDLSNYDTDVTLDLRPGGQCVFSTGQLARLGSGEYASANLYNSLLFEGDRRSLIENARGGGGDDRLTGNGAGNDLWGMQGDDRLFCGWGRDRAFGGAGRDVLKGGGGRDVLKGGAQHDVLVGGKGNDVLSGGWGPDVFKFNPGDGRDRITDFDTAHDRINLHGFGTEFAALEMVDDAGGVHVYVGDVEIYLQHLSAADLSANDFIF